MIATEVEAINRDRNLLLLLREFAETESTELVIEGDRAFAPWVYHERLSDLARTLTIP